MATSGTRLETFAPHLPLAAARRLRQPFDAELNATYDTREKRARTSQRIALLPEDWPEIWRAALPAFGRRVRRGEVVLGRLMPRTRDAVVQAVGMCAGARAWAAARGVVLGDAMDADLLLIGRQGLARDGRGLP